MKPKLYKDFEFLQSDGVIWLYSDPHFNDPESKLMNPNWLDAEEIVKKINARVGKKDTLIILGDIGDERFVRKLKGQYKVLITGNHDKGASNYLRKEEFIPMLNIKLYEKDKKAYIQLKRKEESFIGVTEFNINGPTYFLHYDNKMFDYVYDGPLFISPKILLSHEPISIPFGINIHGHTHGVEARYTYYENDHASINVCSDVVSFEPQRLDQLIEPFKTETIHRKCINKAVEKKGSENGN